MIGHNIKYIWLVQYTVYTLYEEHRINNDYENYTPRLRCILHELENNNFEPIHYSIFFFIFVFSTFNKIHHVL